MKRLARALSLLMGLALLFVACRKVPFTNRVQYNLVPTGIMHGIGASAYQDMLGQERVIRGTDDAQTLRQVGRRIARSAQQPEFEWQYALLGSDDVNAWCLPGGKIGFYTGILPVLESEAGMSFVMGHEVGHATARHGAERMTQQLTLIGGLVGLEIFLSEKSKLTAEQRALVLGAIGLGAQVGAILPFSRKHEAEADVIGLMYMSRAGYPPEESIAVWDRMSAMGGPRPPTFLSTHPSPERRQDNLREWMPQAQKRYARNALDYDTQQVAWGGTPGTEKGTNREMMGLDE